jgi:hypothetical protein
VGDARTKCGGEEKNSKQLNWTTENNRMTQQAVHSKEWMPERDSTLLMRYTAMHTTMHSAMYNK